MRHEGLVAGEVTKLREAALAALAGPGRRYALPRWESWWSMTAEDESRITAINARLRPLAEDPIARPVLITYWVDGYERPLERFVIASHMLPDATRLIPAPADEWRYRATHITIETPEQP